MPNGTDEKKTENKNKMANLTSDLASLTSKKQAFKERQADFDRPKATWFKVKPNETLRVQFLQELSKEAENYREDFGTFLAAVEHTAHGDTGYLSRALDTMETEGRDFAEEMYRKNPEEKGWRKQENFYITVAVDRGQAKPSVEILSRGIHSEFVDDLVEAYNDSDGVGITGKVFKISKGSSKSASWRIKETKDDPLDVAGLVPYDLERDAVRHVPYEQQKEFYFRNYTPESASPVVSDEDEGNASVGNSAAASEELDW